MLADIVRFNRITTALARIGPATRHMLQPLGDFLRAVKNSLMNFATGIFCR